MYPILFSAINDCKSPTFQVNLDEIQTNIFMMTISSKKLTSREFILRLAQVRDADPYKVAVKIGTKNSKSVRFVTQWGITQEDIELAINKVVYVIREFDSTLKNKL